MDRKDTPVTIEYDSRGQRVTRTFPDAISARRFYAAKLRAGKAPRLISGTAK